MEMAKKFGVTRRTLRLALNELENSNMIERIHGKGTFKIGGGNNLRLIYFLLPCADWSIIGLGNVASTGKLLQGLMEACARMDCRLVTLPFSPTNDPEDIDWDVMKMIEPGSMVFVSDIWYRKCFLYLAERQCRVAFLHTQNFDIPFPLDDVEKPIFTKWLQLRKDTEFETGTATEALLNCGCRKPALAATYLTDVTNMRLPGYQKALEKAGIAEQNTVWHIPADFPSEDFIKKLRQFYNRTAFDSLIIDIVTGFEPDYRYSLNKSMNLPEHIKIITLHEYEFNSRLYPIVPAMNYDFRKIGSDAVNMLLAETSKPVIKHYQPRIVNTEVLTSQVLISS